MKILDPPKKRVLIVWVSFSIRSWCKISSQSFIHSNCNNNSQSAVTK